MDEQLKGQQLATARAAMHLAGSYGLVDLAFSLSQMVLMIEQGGMTWNPEWTTDSFGAEPEFTRTPEDDEEDADYDAAPVTVMTSFSPDLSQPRTTTVEFRAGQPVSLAGVSLTLTVEGGGVTIRESTGVCQMVIRPRGTGEIGIVAELPPLKG